MRPSQETLQLLLDLEISLTSTHCDVTVLHFGILACEFAHRNRRV